MLLQDFVHITTLITVPRHYYSAIYWLRPGVCDIGQGMRLKCIYKYVYRYVCEGHELISAVQIFITLGPFFN